MGKLQSFESVRLWKNYLSFIRIFIVIHFTMSEPNTFWNPTFKIAVHSHAWPEAINAWRSGSSDPRQGEIRRSQANQYYERTPAYASIRNFAGTSHLCLPFWKYATFATVSVIFPLIITNMMCPFRFCPKSPITGCEICLKMFSSATKSGYCWG